MRNIYIDFGLILHFHTFLQLTTNNKMAESSGTKKVCSFKTFKYLFVNKWARAKYK